MTKTVDEVHGEGNCSICGKPKKEKHSANGFCSYPHGMIPTKPIDSDHPEGFWSWGFPKGNKA